MKTNEWLEKLKNHPGWYCLPFFINGNYHKIMSKENDYIGRMHFKVYEKIKGLRK